jgi:hypothetical protein
VGAFGTTNIHNTDQQLSKRGPFGTLLFSDMEGPVLLNGRGGRIACNYTFLLSFHYLCNSSARRNLATWGSWQQLEKISSLFVREQRQLE